ncbi:efflux RND transporter periplasmic adaptor subunit [Pseudomonas fluorescens]|uniref:efflux RND transporter periplasmic adaptor subunit n=1 Tax=Pseudomonas fluorescens TaxID=294 RepID=UPI0019086566|nr:efflux RND transporter periplasmic adaptor subunit [Pseudomonas fluorescens]MBD8094590.1 efflux RND transporter periplasmic adaptor subunit [Pseudomonas fluorescens]MBD8720499.1 efflux RND transporter periplasmic adaptor subunit [Pseudomonas fluorescens]
MSTKPLTKFLVVCAFVMTLLVSSLLNGCSSDESPIAPAAPEVSVTTLKPQSQVLRTELTGRTQALLMAEVRPQVGGVVQRRLFVEGSEVKVGQLLYELDAAPYRATVAQAEASLAKSRASLKAARVTARRTAELASIEAVSRQDNDDAQAIVETAAADVKLAEAALKTAQINLTYTRIVAPISGRIETSTVTPGALVVANQEAALTTIQQLDPLYVDVTQSTTELLRLQRELAAGTLRSASAGEADMSLRLEDGSLYNQTGRLKFSGARVNESTGTVTLRAEIANPDHQLLPGMYVRGVLEQARDDQAILVPQQAVTRAASGATSVLLVVDGKVEQRPITVGRAVDNQWWVTSGLVADEQVIVEGGQKVRPGAAVSIVENVSVKKEG